MVQVVSDNLHAHTQQSVHTYASALKCISEQFTRSKEGAKSSHYRPKRLQVCKQKVCSDMADSKIGDS